MGPVDSPAQHVGPTACVLSADSASVAAAATPAEHAAIAALTSSSVEELLSLPRAELESLLAQSGAASSKVLLSLIFRLATLERRLETLGSQARTARVPTIRAPATSLAPVSFGPGAKSDLLEQVFRKNLLLRQGDAG
jgi:hypothetical protein